MDLDENDLFLLIVLVPEAEQILLDVSQPSQPYLPSVKADRLQESWKDSARSLLQKVFPNENSSLLEQFQLIRISRFWYPKAITKSVYLQRFLLFLTLPKEAISDKEVGRNHQWFKTSKVAPVLDPEMSETVRKISTTPHSVSFTFREYSQESFLTDTSPEALKSGYEGKKLQTVLVSSANVTIEDQKRFYREFLKVTFPKLFITFDQFSKLLTSLGWNGEKLKDLFRAFNTRKISGNDYFSEFLSFSEVLCGLCSCEPITPHGGESGEARCRYIFKYYAHQSNGKMNFDEYCSMVRDIREAKGFSVDKDDVENEARASSKVFGCEENDSLSMNDFLTGVGQLKFRGTSHLLRSPESVFGILKALSNEDESEKQTPSNGGDKFKKKKLKLGPENPSLLSFESIYDDDSNDHEMLEQFLSSDTNSGPDYDFATHVIKVKRSGQVVDIKSLWEMEGEIPETVTEPGFKFEKSNFGRLQSIRAFSVTSEANEMLTALRYFERPVKPDKTSLSWGKVEMSVFGKSLIEICQQARGLLIQEPRLVQLDSPTYILGDLHGNFSDLVCFEKVLWRMGPKLVPANFLFLGDYVDRGQYGVEVVAYLLAQKLVAPTKFHLLRGNHECRQIQKNFTFHSECLAKFGEKLGEEIWEEVNRVFDVMPIGALIDGKIFCVHGGIPPPWIGNGLITSLDKVNKDLSMPEEEELVWEYLWNDPLPSDTSVLSESTLDLLKTPESKGFVDNWRRGTGHMFSDNALDEFLNRNKLSHVIRAHEVKKAGFQVQHQQRLLTVFSSSKYCNGSNEAACVLVSSGKLRLIRLDTG